MTVHRTVLHTPSLSGWSCAARRSSSIAVLSSVRCRSLSRHCQCPAEVAAARYGARATHPVHVIKTLPPEAMASCDRPVGIGALVLVDTTVPVDVPGVAARVLAALPD